MSNERTELTERVARDKGEDSDESRLLSCLLNSLQPQDAKQLTDGMIASICPTIKTSALRRAMLYFCSDRIGLFEMVFAVFDNAGRQYDLDPSEVRKMLAQQSVILEGDGSPFVFFRGTSALCALLGDTGGEPP